MNSGMRQQLAFAVLGCFGPLLWTAHSAAAVLCCETGWNLQPIIDLPADPYLCRFEGSAYLCSGNIIGSFKNRAHHEVLAFLDDRSVPIARRREKLARAWSIAADEVQDKLHVQAGDGYAVLPERAVKSDALGDEIPADTLTAIEILDRYNEMTAAMRRSLGSHLDKVYEDRFWLVFMYGGEPSALLGQLGKQPGSVFEPDRMRWGADDILSRKGITFSAIRKTWLFLEHQGSGALGLVKRKAQHRGHSQRVTAEHYLYGNPALIARLDEGIRTHQDATEAVVVRGLDQKAVALKLGAAIETLAQMRRIAEKSGITAVLGLLRERTEVEVTEQVVFNPTPANMRELFLVRRSLYKMIHEGPNRQRLLKIFLPLLVLVTAIEKQLRSDEVGLRREYAQTCLQARKELRCGAAVLPYLEE